MYARLCKAASAWRSRRRLVNQGLPVCCWMRENKSLGAEVLRAARCAIAEGKSASRPRDKNRMLTMRDHKRCCRLQIDEQKKLTQLDWLAKNFVK